MDLPEWRRKIRDLYLAGPPEVIPDRFFDNTYDFPRVTIRPSVYLIAATPRSGSHYLGHLLFATKQLGAPLEYISLYGYRRWQQIVGSEDPVTVLSEIMARRTSPSGWFGVKTHWSQLLNIGRFEIPREMLDFRRIIWIRRCDKIAQAVSFAIAMQTGAWTNFHEAMREPIYDYQAIADCADAIKHTEFEWAQFIRRTSVPHLSLFYEDIRGKEVETVTHILDWFGLPPMDVPISVSLQKQATEINAEWKDRFLHDMRQQ